MTRILPLRVEWLLAATVIVLMVGGRLVVDRMMENEPMFESDSWESDIVAVQFNTSLDLRAAHANLHNTNEEYLPDPKLTPGAIFTTASVKLLSEPGYTKKVRDVPLAEKELALDRYGLPWKLDEHRTLIDPRDGKKWSDKIEFDHLVSLELGGSNAIENIFPQPYDGEWGARRKDQYEDWLHREVVAGRIELADAQRRISGDWIAGMKRDMPDYRPPHSPHNDEPAWTGPPLAIGTTSTGNK